MKNSVQRMKNPASEAVPQSREAVCQAIKTLGDLKREQVRTETQMNDAIANITGQYVPRLEQLKKEGKALLNGIQSWCEAHRQALTLDGKVKTVNFTTGTVSWRLRPASCAIRHTDEVLEVLRRMQLERFIRVKEEINKEAILNDPSAVKGIVGITVKNGVEDFEIKPFEQKDAG
ncbi:host-nuclease inhibitor Gam family protein [Arsenophonus sp. PmNCSU2021_1]|uniref:host-nuclease inhibitor Gam family protein n=1 Tax=Arsenophonus sp. PmNCSU2021_1 TaxID=3118989 RepID=UPI002FEF8198